MVSAIIAYGSRARGDYRRTSDIDLLGLTSDELIKKVPSVCGVAIHLYPFDEMIKNAKAGDLFVSHVVFEGKPVLDPFGLHEQLRSVFEYKSSYKKLKIEAASVIWFCVNFSNIAPEKNLRSRLVWAIRTLIICDAAEKRVVAFGSGDLEEYSEIENLKKVIDRRTTVELKQIISLAKRVARKFYRLNRPRDRSSSSSVINWLEKKGPVAKGTPSFLKIELEKSRAFKASDDFY